MRLDDGKEPLLESLAGQAPVETMRFLPAGRHRRRIEGQPSELIVWAVPVLFYNVYWRGTQIVPVGPFSREKPFWMSSHWRVFRAQGATGSASAIGLMAKSPKGQGVKKSSSIL